MTWSELNRINKRFKEIDILIDQCVVGVDDDVIDNLEAEVARLLARLEQSIKKARIRESNLRLVE